MSEVKKCSKCRAKMVRKLLVVETSETGVPYWGIYGAEPVAYVCNKCGFIELYDEGKMTRKRKRSK